MKRLLLLLSGLLTLALFPATSAASNHAGGIIYTDPVQVHGYKMNVLAVTSSKHHGAVVAISFTRGTSNDNQTHYYQFGNPADVHVKLAPGGASGSIKANLGHFGRIDMTFSAGGGGRTTPGCPGALLFEHAGSLSGTFHFVSWSTYFSTIDRGSLHASTATGQKGISCKPPGQIASHGTSLDVSEQTISGTHALGIVTDFNIVRDHKGFLQEELLVIDASRSAEGINVYHAVDVSKLPASAFTNASDLSSAQAFGSGQFLTGNVTYASTSILSPTGSTGTITGGSITANFDVGGSVTLPGTSGFTTAGLSVS